MYSLELLKGQYAIIELDHDGIILGVFRIILHEMFKVRLLIAQGH